MKFEEIYKLDVSDKTEKKGNLTYLSWAYAWAEFKKIYPEATYEVKKFDGLPYVKEEGVGYVVYTSVAADGLCYEMWLPVMDSRNHAILKPTMFEINKSIMRCLTKNLAMFGLGLYIYAGEDLPDGEENAPPRVADESPEKKQETKENANGADWRLSKTELVAAYEVASAEKAIAYYERALGGKAFADWTKEDTEVVREDLEKKLEKRNAKRRMEAIDGDLPFGV